MGTLARILSTWFGAGYVPKGPGTAGALAALPFAWLAGDYVWLLAALSLRPAVWAADVYAKSRGSKDPQEVVLDEVVGQWIALAGATHLGSPWPWLLAFGLFRLFDIWKPYPIRALERLEGGRGIIFDDVMAGLYAALVMRVAGWNNLY